MPTLQWLDDEQARRAVEKVPYRMLQPDDTLSCGERDAGNMLIQGDNLDALKALMPYVAGRVKCIFIDPPYNTGSAFEQYDDNVEHSTWLSLMYPRLELLRDLLAEDGSIWVTIDDNESHYLKVIMDEVFGRKNFVGNVIWEKSDSPRMDAEFLSSRHDHVIVFAQNKAQTKWHRISTAEGGTPRHYDKTDTDGRRYYLKPLRAMGGQGDSRLSRPTLYYPMIAPDGTEVFPKRQDGTDGAWRWSRDKAEEEQDRLEWVQGRNGWTLYYRIYADTGSGRPPETIWPHPEVGSNRTSKREVKQLFPESVPFGTPKPERLIQRVLQIATDPGDLVLDSFLGSGTTAAVAHKMGRRWIGIEMGDHAVTHCAPRLKKVVGGEQGGISKAVGWKGGGGFRFYRLGEAVFDAYGVINPKVTFEALAAHIWFAETGTPAPRDPGKSPLLGVHNGTAYYLLYNGILGDKRIAGGNVLNSAIYAGLPPFDGPKVIYGEWCPWSEKRLKEEQVTFKQTPYDIRVR